MPIYRVGAWEIDGVELNSPQEIALSVENINSTTSLYGLTTLTAILDYIRLGSTPIEISTDTAFTLGTVSASFTLITGFTSSASLPAGKYKVDISATVYTAAALITLGAEARAQFQLFVGGVAVSQAIRDNSGANSYTNLAFNDIITVNGSQAIDLRMRLVTGASCTISNRVMILTKVS